MLAPPRAVSGRAGTLWFLPILFFLSSTLPTNFWSLWGSGLWGHLFKKSWRFLCTVEVAAFVLCGHFGYAFLDDFSSSFSSRRRGHLSYLFRGPYQSLPVPTICNCWSRISRWVFRCFALKSSSSWVFGGLHLVHIKYATTSTKSRISSTEVHFGHAQELQCCCLQKSWNFPTADFWSH